VLLAATVVEQLTGLLQAIDAPPQAFARNHPDEVAAMVLIDSASPFEPTRCVRLDRSDDAGLGHGDGGGGLRAECPVMLAGPRLFAFSAAPRLTLLGPKQDAVWMPVRIRRNEDRTGDSPGVRCPQENYPRA
jgi:hypothetical protein